MGGFRRLWAARYFPIAGKVPKGSLGDAADGHLVPIGPLTPSPPFYGGYPLGQAESFRRAKSEWRSKFPPGHRALGLQKLPLVQFNFRAWLNRTNGTGAGYTVGAAISRPSLPPWRGKVPSKARRMRVGSEMAPPQRAGQCPAPTKRRNSFYIRRRGGTPGRPFPSSTRAPRGSLSRNWNDTRRGPMSSSARAKEPHYFSSPSIFNKKAAIRKDFLSGLPLYCC